MRTEHTIHSTHTFYHVSGSEIHVIPSLSEVLMIRGGILQNSYSSVYSLNLVVESSACYVSFIQNVQGRYAVEQRNLELQVEYQFAIRWLSSSK